LSEASSQNPGSFEERKAVRRTKWHGCLFFWFVFFGQAKKMNNIDEAFLSANLKYIRFFVENCADMKIRQQPAAQLPYPVESIN